MCTVYILYSKITGKYYTGQTQDLVNRLEEHNSGESKSISNSKPWELIWSRRLSTRSEAMKREQNIKKRGAKRYLNDISVG